MQWKEEKQKSRAAEHEKEQRWEGMRAAEQDEEKQRRGGRAADVARPQRTEALSFGRKDPWPLIV